MIGVVTLLRPGKGIETLDRRDARPCSPSIRKRAWRWPGAAPTAQLLEARARALGVGHAFTCGRDDGPMPLLAGADIFVSASWAESFPYNVLEAMAVGLPVVATDVGGTGEAVEDGTTGLLVPPRDRGSARRSDLEAARRPRAAPPRFGNQAASAWPERFTVDAMVEGTLEVYRQVGVLP